MIPERNLMATCPMEHEQKLSWIATSNEMMNEGPRIILRLPKIRHTLSAHPEPLRWYSGRKIEFELLGLLGLLEMVDTSRRLQCMDVKTDGIMQVIHKRRGIVKEVIQRMYMEGSRVNDELKVW
ncbi:hypothetical protein DPMN_120020 [Dreissena polymorpha]|uniref:Uncharacterized protein n=1 Tax=Dreissena polymorpha TaxID=45954 RepID=A0A9D4JSF3_DREPO|nr:hypothetical protein DPMN_120020 [Dreissena polymorpha]